MCGYKKNLAWVRRGKMHVQVGEEHVWLWPVQMSTLTNTLYWNSVLIASIVQCDILGIGTYRSFAREEWKTAMKRNGSHGCTVPLKDEWKGMNLLFQRLFVCQTISFCTAELKMKKRLVQLLADATCVFSTIYSLFTSNILTIYIWSPVILFMGWFSFLFFKLFFNANDNQIISYLPTYLYATYLH